MIRMIIAILAGYVIYAIASTLLGVSSYEGRPGKTSRDFELYQTILP